jgi:RNA polymerase sigma-70 factor (ECF subfamily)
MPGREVPSEGTKEMLYCLVPRDLAPKLHEPLRKHFGGDPSVEVVVERRASERRTLGDRRRTGGCPPQDRRRIRHAGGRRAGDRRAVAVAVPGPELPRRARPHADRLTFAERLEPSTQQREDVDTARLITRMQAGERDLFALLYMRYFDRVYGYARILLGNGTEAEDVTQHVFTEVIEWLPRYELRDRPFRAWLFTVARNRALTQLKRDHRLDVVDPFELGQLGEEAAEPDTGIDVLDWISDRELAMFVERLPLAQRQVLVLVFMLGLTTAEAASVLGRTPDTVRKQQSRALAFLRTRLSAAGRAPRRGHRIGTRVLVRHAVVLRSRRHCLTRH